MIFLFLQSQCDELTVNILYGGNVKEKSDHGEDIQVGLSNAEPVSSQAGEKQRPDEYTYVVDRRSVQTKDRPLVIKNATSVNTDTVYYETATPDSAKYTYMYVEKTGIKKSGGNNEAIAVDSEYAGLDGTHARTNMGHRHTEGDYY